MEIHIKNLLSESLRRAGVTKQVTATMVCEAFDKVVVEVLGDKVKDKIKAKYHKDYTLTVAVLGSVYSQEIRLHEAEILEKLHKIVGPNKVEKFRFMM